MLLLLPIEPLLFHSSKGFDVAFRVDSKRVTHLLIGTDAFEKLNWYETTKFQLGLLGFCLLIFLSELLVWLLRTQPRRLIGRVYLTTLTSGLNLAFLIGMVLVLLLGNLYEFAYRVPPAMVALLCIPILTASLTGVLLIMTLLRQNKYWSKPRLAHHYLVMLALIAMVWFLNYWNLLGFRFG